jgi:hypothetical protein
MLMKLRHLTIIAAAALAAACESPTPSGLARIDAPAEASRDVVASTSGGGKAELPPGFSLLEFAYNAKAHADGSASGQFRQFYESADGTVDFHGSVTCVTFDPVNNRAWIGGVVTQNRSTDPAAQTPIHQVGKDAWFRVVDDGEGKSSVDRTTVLGFEGSAGIETSPEYCAAQLWRPANANAWVVVAGNIQVRP